MKELRIILTLIIVIFSFRTKAQNNEQFRRVLDSANVLVKQFYGEKYLEKYITLNRHKSKIKGSKLGESITFDKEPNFDVERYVFEYNLVHKVFRNDTAVILFTLNRNGQLLLGEGTQGLYFNLALDSLESIDKSLALTLVKDYLPKGKNRWNVRLRWYEIDPVILMVKDVWDYPDVIKGYFTWAVESEVELFQVGCFQFTKKVAFVDIFTGKIIEVKNE